MGTATKRRRQLLEIQMGRKQTDIDRIAELELELKNLKQKIKDKDDNLRLLIQQMEEYTERHRLPSVVVRSREGGGPEDYDLTITLTVNKVLTVMQDYGKSIRNIKEWVKQLPIEARVDMPELQS